MQSSVWPKRNEPELCMYLIIYQIFAKLMLFRG